MASPPNVIVVLTDQLRPFELGCYGGTGVATPCLDRVAAEGVRFDLGVSNNPVCTPARSCLLTGQYGRTCTGELGNVADDPPCPRRRRLPDPTLAEVLRGRGYDTALVGKWHIDPSPSCVGFASAWYPLTIHRYRGQRYFTHDRLGPPAPGYAPEAEAARVRDHLRRQKPGRPFFLFYNISLPHMPIGPADLPPRYARLCAPAAAPLRPNVFRDGQPAHSDRWFKVYTRWDYFWRLWGPCWNAAPECGYPNRSGEQPGDALPPGFDLRHLTALYLGAVAWVDDLVGHLLDTLASHGLDEDTVLLFTSDHGDNLGSHQLFNKDCLFDESIRIPFLVRWPGRLAPRVATRQIATLIDVMPTLLDLCGVPCPPTVHGQSLGPILRGQRPDLRRNAAFIETDPFHFGRPCAGIRTPQHLYGAFFDRDHRALGESWGFYDLARDPWQEHNALTPAAPLPPAARALRRRLAQWHRTTPWLQPR